MDRRIISITSQPVVNFRIKLDFQCRRRRRLVFGRIRPAVGGLSATEGGSRPRDNWAVVWMGDCRKARVRVKPRWKHLMCERPHWNTRAENYNCSSFAAANLILLKSQVMSVCICPTMHKRRHSNSNVVAATATACRHDGDVLTNAVSASSFRALKARSQRDVVWHAVGVHESRIRQVSLSQLLVAVLWIRI